MANLVVEDQDSTSIFLLSLSVAVTLDFFFLESVSRSLLDTAGFGRQPGGVEGHRGESAEVREIVDVTFHSGAAKSGWPSQNVEALTAVTVGARLCENTKNVDFLTTACAPMLLDHCTTPSVRASPCGRF